VKKIESVICADAVEHMKSMRANSIDTIITDPPYELGFMGKSWDSAGVSFQKETWEAALRVAKPGATLLCFGGTRTYHRIACAIEDAGWVIKDCIMFLHGQGFPKATDISKQLDKKAGKKGKLIRKQKLAGTAATLKGKANRKDWYDQGKGGTHTPELEIRKPATAQSKLWYGWKSHGLKPAYEPIIVAMKPNEGTYAENALKYGVSGLWIDGGRIGTDIITSVGTKGKRKFKIGKNNPVEVTGIHQGRYPANVILDEEAGRLLDEQSGVSKSQITNFKVKGRSGGIMGKIGKDRNYVSGFKDKGGASRFFYCAKASKAERNRGCEGMEEKKINIRKGDENCLYNDNKKVAKNTHPTIKPLKLMEYLCTITKTPTGGVVLDPFGGSGTTGIACKNTGRHFILIEKEKEYCKIAEARIKAAEKQLTLDI